MAYGKSAVWEHKVFFYIYVVFGYIQCIVTIMTLLAFLYSALVSTSFFPSKIVGGLSQGNFKNCYLHEISSSISFDSL